MPIDFSTWVSRMSNSILDASIVDRPTYSVESITPYQARMLIANLLVPVVADENDVNDWISAFCVAISGDIPGSRVITEYKLAEIVGQELAKDYYATEGAYESITWLMKFKTAIKQGLSRSF